MLASVESTFEHLGSTRTVPMAHFAGYHSVTRRTFVGMGTAVHAAAVGVVMAWGVKTRAGFRVSPAGGEVAVATQFVVTLGPVREPISIAWVADGSGFGYATRLGHPLVGEEAFLVEVDHDDRVWFVNRSISRPSGAWRVLAPGLRIAQHYFTRRYGRMIRAAVKERMSEATHSDKVDHAGPRPAPRVTNAGIH